MQIMENPVKRKRAPRQAPALPYHHGDLRNALLREGRAVLEERGATELSLREVARRAGVSEAAPFKHFNGKESLLAAIATQGFEELARQRQEIAAGGLSTHETARQMMHSYVQYALRNKGVFNLMVGPRIVDQAQYPDLLERGAVSFNYFSNQIVALARESGWPEASRELVAHAAWALEHGLATLILAQRAPRLDRQIELNRMIDFSIDLVLGGIAAGPAALQMPATLASETATSPTRRQTRGR